MSDDGAFEGFVRLHRPALLAAAAVLSLAAGIVVSTQLGGHGHLSVHSPTPSLTPIPTPTNSVGPTSSAPKPSPTSSTHSSSAPTTKQLEVLVGHRPVTLTVPLSWQVSRTQPYDDCGCGAPVTTCIVSGRSEWGGSFDNCVLTVTEETDPVPSMDPDFPWPEMDVTCKLWSATAEADVTVQGRPAQYRAFTDGCNGRRSEQWTTLDRPTLTFWHPIASGSATATIKQVMATALLPAVIDSRRQFDEGYITDVRQVGSGYEITIDRVVIDRLGHAVNHNPATYTYQLVDRYQSSYTLAQLQAQFRKGRHPVDGTPAVDHASVQLYADVGGYDADLGWPRFFA